ncbi:MAG: nuclear transport factor 2 family protein, partial [Bacteroidota bacterium]
MKKSLLQFSIFPLILLLCLTFSCEQQRVKVDVETDIAAIKDLVNQYGAAVNAGDLDLWISLWADNGIQMP